MIYRFNCMEERCGAQVYTGFHCIFLLLGCQTSFEDESCSYGLPVRGLYVCVTGAVKIFSV
jgi:hypothetical protein